MTLFYIEKNFISEQEYISVRQKVHELNNLWQVHFNPSIGLKFNTLGNALYLMNGPNNINHIVKETLIENFNWLYKRICNKISDMTGCDTELHPKLTAPGFHIGNMPGNFKINFYHIDSSIVQYDTESSIDTVYSVLIPIEMPSAGACLQYLENNKEEKLIYELGGFYRWKATLQHKIGDSVFLPGEHRITLQCHYYYNKNSNKNYVYF